MDFTWECLLCTMLTCSSFLLVPSYSFLSFISCKEKEFSVLCLCSTENIELNCCENSPTLCPKKHWYNFWPLGNLIQILGCPIYIRDVVKGGRKAVRFPQQWFFRVHRGGLPICGCFYKVDDIGHWSDQALGKTSGLSGEPFPVSTAQFMLHQEF